MYKPTLQQARSYAEDYSCVPVCREIYADIITPIEVLRRLKNVSKQCFILESVEDREKWGRYTFLGFNPVLEIINDQAKIEQIMDEYKSPRIEGLPPFTGGLAGFFTYEKSFDLMLFDKLVAFDNLTQKIIIIANAKTERLEENYNKAVTVLEETYKIITRGEPALTENLQLASEFRELFSRDEYCKKVKKAQQYIKNKEVGQVVISNLTEADIKGSLFDAYRVLRTINPSPYMFYFTSEKNEIAGASPETLIKLTSGNLRTFPIGGTRPRGNTPVEDKRIENQLLNDKKELKEHDMLVELAKADLNSISKEGSVEVEDYMAIKRFSHVMHITSAVTGKIEDDKSFIDAVNAVLPAGTLSGAPRKRACEIIDELEQSKRGIYGGALGYISFTGDMDLCISIRLAFKQNNKVYVRSGAGVVAESIPEREYEECVNKAKAVITALKLSNGGIDKYENNQ